MRLVLVLLIWLCALPAQAACRQALVLALDISSSVDAREYSLQMQGLAAALSDPEVSALLLTQPNAPIDLAVFQWGGRFDQQVIQPWITLGSAADIAAVASRLNGQIRPPGTRSTALGTALEFAAELLQSRQKCWELTVDISGDGKHNDGPRPSIARRAPAFARTTVNALVIGTDAPPGDQIASNEVAELTSYFRVEVLNGENAFLETALGFDDFARAMKVKLLREVNIAIAALEPLK